VRASANIGERKSVCRYSPLVSRTLGLSYSTRHAMAAQRRPVRRPPSYLPRPEFAGVLNQHAHR
jgi:hypothetical protein